jgi:hypothetical protein
VPHRWKRFCFIGVLSIAATEVGTAANSIDAPLHNVGDSWTWRVRVSPRDTCTQGINDGAKYTQTITAVTESGYTAEFTGPREGARFTRSYGKDLAFDVKVKGRNESVRSDVLNVPIEDGKSWATTLVSGNVVTTLNCKAGRIKRITVAAEELEVAPISCKGTWKNLQSGNSDSAVYEYWYSPARRNLARWTVFTYFMGKTCADIEYVLESASR